VVVGLVYDGAANMVGAVMEYECGKEVVVVYEDGAANVGAATEYECGIVVV
jgi:hypothetical protein